ncbi:MAG: heme exporter protein CcmD [Rhodospirillaceae bacterium]|nr:MAG: heme exporter protein CcmD [Rhodospirillaceae bacterium]
MQDFLNMGGYGSYIWPSYGITAVVMLGVLIASLKSLKSTEATYKRLLDEMAEDVILNKETES